MGLLKIIRELYTSKHPHFLSVDKEIYFRWKFLIKMAVLFNRNYKSCEIFRKRYKFMQNFVVVGLRFNGKNVRRRTTGFAKEFLQYNRQPRCIYCNTLLSQDNATADHIIPISKGGNNTQINLVVCCKDCNNERGNTEFNKYLILKNKKFKNIRTPFI